MSALLAAVSEFVDAIRGQQAWVEELNDLSRRVADHLRDATPAEIDEALRRYAALFPNVPLVAVGLVALNCGSLVENGGDPTVAGPALLDKLPRVLETATEFYDRCRAMAEADPGLVAELREQAAAAAEDDAENEGEPAGERAAGDLVNEHVENEGWQVLAQRFGPTLFQDAPAAVLGHMSEDVFRLGLIAHLSRSKPLRAAARSRPELLDLTLRADAATGVNQSFLATMLRVLDDEPFTVIHTGQGRGYDVRVGGIADNFQFHTLLAGALIGDPNQGWLTGERPSRRAVAECRDAPVGAGGGADVTGAFNLWNWTGLRPDGTLSEGYDGSPHWVWNEGCPADVAAFEGRRVLLLGPPPYQRFWRAGRQFHGMTGELTVERTLGPEEVSNWLRRLAAAPRPTAG